MAKFICRGPRAGEVLTPEQLQGWTAKGKAAGDRVGCGEDLDEIINALPKDGEEHDFQCPVCGNAGTAVTPIAGD